MRDGGEIGKIFLLAKFLATLFFLEFIALLVEAQD